VKPKTSKGKKRPIYATRGLSNDTSLTNNTKGNNTTSVSRNEEQAKNRSKQQEDLWKMKEEIIWITKEMDTAKSNFQSYKDENIKFVELLETIKRINKSITKIWRYIALLYYVFGEALEKKLCT